MEILLCTLNAKYIHTAFGLRCLRANLGELRARSALCEFTLKERPIDIVEALLARRPRLVGLGVYIWNAVASLAVVRLLKQLAPEVVVVLGGPEVSHEPEAQEIVALADYVILGEGERAFAQLAQQVLTGTRPAGKQLAGGLPDLNALELPYTEYTAEDLAHRILYVEASRGCPFKCEFCLSSLDERVRSHPLERFLAALDELVSRGARQLKFVDRTFNLSPRVSQAILDFLLERQHLGLFAHFEMIPDRLPEGLRTRLARFPPGALQLEIGVQTFDPAVAERISRPQDAGAVEENLRWLSNHAGAHVHADLIVGLPGEEVDSFAAGFNRLVALGPAEIQVGVLKRLRGTPIGRHEAAEGMVWSAEPPYEILQSRVIPFAQMQRLKRFARVWDLVANRGNFVHAAPLLWGERPPFEGFLEFSDWVAERASLGGIALARLARLIQQFLVERRAMNAEQAALALAPDLARHAQRRSPELPQSGDARPKAPSRQQRHQAKRSAFSARIRSE